MVFDYEEGDVFSCVADIGWITGHSYVVYGPLSNGGTTVLFESTPTYPNPGRNFFFINDLKPDFQKSLIILFLVKLLFIVLDQLAFY